MAEVTIEIEGLAELIRKFDQLPTEVQQAIVKTMNESLNTVHESVMPYAPQAVPPEVYRRTGTLGRRLGVNMGGGKMGKPDIYTVSGAGKDMIGTFGTNLSYAPYVIGPRDAPKGERQAYMHQPGYNGRTGWWTMDDVKEKAEPKIKRLWDKAIEAITRKFNL